MILVWILVPLGVIVVAVALVPVLSAMLREERFRQRWRLRRGHDNSFERAFKKVDRGDGPA
jgi:hypothetical protein